MPRDKTNRSSVSTMPYVCILVCVQVSPVAQQCVCGKLGTRFLLQFHRRFCCSLSHIGMAFLVERDTFLDFAKPSLDPRRTGSFPPRRRKAEHEHQLEPLSPRQVKLQELVPTGMARFSVFIGRGDKGNAATTLFPEMNMPCNTFVIDYFATSMGMTVGKFMNLYRVILPAAARHIWPEVVIASTLHGRCLSIVRDRLRGGCANSSLNKAEEQSNIEAEGDTNNAMPPKPQMTLRPDVSEFMTIWNGPMADFYYAQQLLHIRDSCLNTSIKKGYVIHSLFACPICLMIQ